MLNLRQRNLQYSALRYPMRFIETVLSVAALYQPGGHSTAKFNRVQQQMYEQREKRYEDDPKWVPPETSCKKNLKRLLYREELS